MGLKCYVARQLYHEAKEMFKRKAKVGALDFKTDVVASEEVVDHDFIFAVILLT